VKKRKSPRHAFKFTILNEDGSTQTLIAWAKVKPAKLPVDLELNPDDVRRSMRLKGVGNTQTCSMAVCAKRQADRFPHPVEGYIDWQYARAYVVTKLDKRTRLPSECVAYRHSDDIAKLNDTSGGQLKLLESLEKNGSRVISLRPPDRPRIRLPGKPIGRKTGDRTSRPAAVGAKLRFAVAQLGLV
jgi:hypothetical protein